MWPARSFKRSAHTRRPAMSSLTFLLSSTGKITRQELALIMTPPATSSHKPIPHHEIVQAVVETLGFRHIGVVRDEYAVSPDGMRMFGVLDLETGMHGCRFSNRHPQRKRSKSPARHDRRLSRNGLR